MASPSSGKLDGVSPKQVGRGVLWAYLAFAGGKALVFVSTVILARLLTPADFGLVGLASIVTAYLGTVHTFGVGEALIQRKSQVPEAANATFVLSAASGVLLFALSLILAPLAAAFFHEPRVGPILPTLAFTYLISGLITVNEAMLVKKLSFQRRVVPVLAQALLKGISSIVLALLGFGAWAIVWGVVIGTVAKAVAVWIISPWRPSRVWNTRVAREIFGFGSHLVLLNFISNIEENIDYLIVGKRLGAAPLGLYTLGYRAPELLIVNLAAVISDVAFPVYAKIQDDLAALRRSLLKALQLIAWIAIPAGVGLAAISGAFVRTFYTEKWAEAIPAMQVLAIYAAVRAVTYNFGDAYKAIGRPDILNKIGLATLGLTIGALWLGANYGITGVAWAHLLMVAFIMVVEALVAWRLLGIPPRQVLGAVLGPIACSAIMALAMVSVTWAVRGLANEYLLVLQSFVGATTYLGAAWLLNRSVTVAVWLNLRQVLGWQARDSRGVTL